MCRKPSLSILFVSAAILCLAWGTVARSQVPDPVSLWRFEGDTTDSGTGGNDGTLEGTAALVTDPERGLCLELDGNGWVSTDAWVAELAEADFTIAAWIQTSEVSLCILSKCDGDSSWEELEKQWYVNEEDTGEGGIDGSVDYVGWGCDWVRGTLPADDGQWHHVALTWDIDASEGHVYVDGVEGTDQGGFNESGEPDNEGDTVRIGFSPGAHSDNFVGLIDDVAIFDVALTAGQVVELMDFSLGSPGKASSPEPADGETDVPLAVVLDWTPGVYADRHDVYFGADFNDVNDATTTVDPQNVYKGRQNADIYAVPETLDYGQTYYWRIDEVNAAPDFAVHRGDVWSFTAE
ncbi:MAG: LamG domain-containing protein, partial [Planctomycetota bacterium]